MEKGAACGRWALAAVGFGKMALKSAARVSHVMPGEKRLSHLADLEGSWPKAVLWLRKKRLHMRFHAKEAPAAWDGSFACTA